MMMSGPVFWLPVVTMSWEKNLRYKTSLYFCWKQGHAPPDATVKMYLHVDLTTFLENVQFTKTKLFRQKTKVEHSLNFTVQYSSNFSQIQTDIVFFLSSSIHIYRTDFVSNGNECFFNYYETWMVNIIFISHIPIDI